MCIRDRYHTIYSYVFHLFVLFILTVPTLALAELGFLTISFLVFLNIRLICFMSNCVISYLHQHSRHTCSVHSWRAVSFMQFRVVLCFSFLVHSKETLLAFSPYFFSFSTSPSDLTMIPRYVCLTFCTCLPTTYICLCLPLPCSYCISFVTN